MLKREVFGIGVCKNCANRFGTKIAYAPKKINSLRPRPGTERKKREGWLPLTGYARTRLESRNSIPERGTYGSHLYPAQRGDRAVEDFISGVLYGLLVASLLLLGLPRIPLCNYILAYSGEFVNTFFKNFFISVSVAKHRVAPSLAQ